MTNLLTSNLRVVSFNILAPEYKRINPLNLPSNISNSRSSFTSTISSTTSSIIPSPPQPSTNTTTSSISSSSPSSSEKQSSLSIISPSSILNSPQTTLTSNSQIISSPSISSREISYPDLVQSRMEETLTFLEQNILSNSPSTDIIILQELSQRAEYLNNFKKLLETYGYSLYTMKRTGGKTDGIGIAIRTSSNNYQIIQEKGIQLCKKFHRVALFLWVKVKLYNNYNEEYWQDMIIIGTHLASPTDCKDCSQQILQIKQLHLALMHQENEWNLKEKAIHLLAGDFNSPPGSDVWNFLRYCNFEACFERKCPINLILSNIKLYETSKKYLNEIKKIKSITKNNNENNDEIINENNPNNNNIKKNKRRENEDDEVLLYEKQFENIVKEEEKREREEEQDEKTQLKTNKILLKNWYDEEDDEEEHKKRNEDVDDEEVIECEEEDDNEEDEITEEELLHREIIEEEQRNKLKILHVESLNNLNQLNEDFLLLYKGKQEENKVKNVENTDVNEEISENIDELLPFRLFVSHRHHSKCNVGVDHIFFKLPHDLSPFNTSSSSTETSDAKLITSVNSTSLTSSLSNCSSTSSSISVDVVYSSVLPEDISCHTWPSSFTISDHRPICTEIIIKKII